MNKNFYLIVVLTILITSVSCSFFGQVLLFLINRSEDYYSYLIYLTPGILILTKLTNKYFKTTNVGMKYFIAAREGEAKLSGYFPILLVINTYLAHITGVSVGREGVAVQLGGAIGLSLAKNNFFKSEKKFLVRLGMISGFAALFQTPLAAIFFIFEITSRKIKVTRELFIKFGITLVAAYFSQRLSNYLGLEKFFININVNFSDISLLMYLEIVICGIIFILVGMSFAVFQKKLKGYLLNKQVLACGLLLLFIILSIITKFKYASLGINLIDNSFSEISEIMNYDFIIKLILTVFCTTVGFSGGEVTPLFAIGASLGVSIALIFSLPTVVVAALGYCLVFASATKTCLTPIFLALEVFGIKVMILIILPAILIYFINKKYSIYE